jgi:hypothetical protein
LATDRKTPLREAAASTPARAEKTDTRSKVARRRAIVGGVLVLAIVGGGAYLASRGGDGVMGIIGGSQTPTPDLTFKVVKVIPQTTTKTRPKDVADAVQPVADKVATALDTLYTGSYVDPAVWSRGRYADVFGDVMDEAAAEQALAQLDALTLGPDAGTTYDFVEPGRGTIAIRVLTGADDKPVQAIASVVFGARAGLDDDTYTKISSTGEYFFRKLDGEWRIFSFRVDHREKPTSAPVTASPSAEASG